MKYPFWDNYNQSVLNDQVVYFYDLWIELIDYYSRNKYGLNLKSPHVILKEIVDVVFIENNYRKDTFSEYFKKEVNNYLKTDVIIQNKFNGEFKLLLEKLAMKDYSFTVYYCRDLLNLFKSGAFFEELHNKLKKILLKNSPSDDDYKDLKKYCQYLIIEYYLRGYSLDTIKKIIQISFDTYQIHFIGKTPEIYSQYPHNIDYNNFKKSEERISEEYEFELLRNFILTFLDLYSIISTESEKVNIEDYPEFIGLRDIISNQGYDKKNYFHAVKRTIDSLTISDRLEALKSFFYQESKKSTFVFHLSGIKGPNVDIILGGVKFYSPYRERLIVDNKYWSDTLELDYKLKENEDSGSIYKGVNAAVDIDYYDEIVGLDLSYQKVVDSLNLLFFFKSQEHSIITIDKNSAFIIGNGLPHSLPSTMSRAQKNKFFPLNVQELDPKLNKESIIGDLNNAYDIIHKDPAVDGRIKENLSKALYWYKKARESDIEEDKLLYYWIIVETLICKDYELFQKSSSKEKIDIIKKFIPNYEAYNYFFEVGTSFHDYLVTLKNTSFFLEDGGRRRLLELPDEVERNCGLKHGFDGKWHYNLITFIENIDEISNQISDKIIIEKLDYLLEYYKNGKFAEKELSKQIESSENEIQMIYLYRNNIVHNAKIDRHNLSYFTLKTEKYAEDLIVDLISQLMKNKEISYSELLYGKKLYVESKKWKLNDNSNLIDLLSD